MESKQRVVTAFQRRVGNPVLRRLPWQTVIETTGRKSGKLRRTPVGARRDGDTVWLVSEYGDRSHYVRNLLAEPRVRVRLKGRWHTGTAHILREDDARARLRTLPKLNSAAVLALGSRLQTVRIDLDR